MSYDANTERMDWKDESTWVGISLISGLMLFMLFAYFDRFPEASSLAVALCCCLGFYVLSILLRLQNHRGEFWLGKTIHRESRLKVAFPIVGFLFGLTLLVF